MTKKLLLAFLILIPALGRAAYQPITGSTVTVNPLMVGGVAISTSNPMPVQSTGTTVVSVTGTPNVSVSNTPAVSQSGTWTVQPGNTQNTTPWQMISTYTVVSTTYPISVSGTFSLPALTTVTFNGASQPVSLQNGVMVDSSAWTLGASSQVPVGGVFIPNPSAIIATSTTTASVRINKYRSQYMTLMDDNNVILGTATANPVIVNGSGVTQPVSGTFFPALSTVTFNAIGQPVTSSYTIVSTTYPISVSATFSPVGTTTTTFNAIGQPVTSTYTVVSTTYPMNVSVVQSTVGVVNAGQNLNVSVQNVSTITFNAIGQPVTSTSSFIVGLVSSTTLPSPLSNGTTNGILVDSTRRIITADVPFEVILTTFNVAAAPDTTERILVSSATAPQRTLLCGCIFENTSATNTGFIIYQSTSGLASNPFYPVGVPASYVPAGVRTDCGHPVFASVPGGQLTIKPEAAASSVRMNCQYLQK